MSDRQHQAVGGLRAGELRDVGLHLLRLAAQIDGLPHEITLQPPVWIASAELVGLAAWKSSRAVRVSETKALIDLGIEPGLGALPQTHAGEQRCIRGLAGLAAARQAELSLIRRADGGIALPEKRGLAVKINPVDVRRRRRLGDHRQCAGRQRIVAELIIQAGAQFLQLEVGIDPLRAAEKRHALGAIVGEQIFEARGPMRCNRYLDAGSRRETQSPQERLFDGAGGKLGQRLPIVSPGESAGRVQQPIAGRIADPAAHRAGSEHRLAEGFRAQCRRRQVRGAADRDAGEIGPARERRVDLGAE